MKIPVTELRALTNRLLDDLEQQGHQVVDLSDDYYWDIGKNELYDPSKDPEELSLGQLTHDWERLQRILTGQNQPLAYGLVWLAAVLRAIGYQIVH